MYVFLVNCTVVNDGLVSNSTPLLLISSLFTIYNVYNDYIHINTYLLHVLDCNLIIANSLTIPKCCKDNRKW